MIGGLLTLKTPYFWQLYKWLQRPKSRETVFSKKQKTKQNKTKKKEKFQSSLVSMKQ